MYRYTLWMALLAACAPASGSVLLVDERFSTFTGAGIAPGGEGGALDSLNWSLMGFSDGDSDFGARHLGGDFGRGLSQGGTRTGGVHAFVLPGGERGLGLQATGSDFTPGVVLRRVTNTASVQLLGLQVLLDLWILNDGPRSTGIRFDAVSVLSPVTVRNGDAGVLHTPAGADIQGWRLQAYEAAVPDLPLDAGGEAILRWNFDDASGSGARDEVALSRLQVLGTVRTGPDVTTLAAPDSRWLLAAAGAAMLAGPRRRLLILNRSATVA